MIPFEYLPPAPTRGLLPGISFVHGDLTKILRDNPVDALLVSAFPDDYTETPSSLIGALSRAGVSVAELASSKADDLRSAFRCWVSHPLQPELATSLGFKRIICFETSHAESLSDGIMAIGQALSAVVTTHQIRSVAMPLIATGDQGNAITDVMPPLLETLTRHMRPGARLQHVMIAAYDESRIPEIRNEVAKFRSRPIVSPPLQAGHDVFISYRHTDKEAANHLEKAILATRPETTIWIDREKLELGHRWNDEISAAIDSTRLFVPCYSKGYFNSPICREELTAAHIRRRAMNKSFILPVLLDDVKLTSFHQVTQYHDSRGGAVEELTTAAQLIVARLTGNIPDWEFRSDGCERCALS